MKVPEDKTQVPVKVYPMLKGQHILCKQREISRYNFYKKNTLRIHIETIASQAIRTFISIYPLLKCEHLNINTELNLYKAFIRSITTCTCPTWELAADSCLLKLQRVQNKVLRTIGNLPRRTLNRDLHVAFTMPYLNDSVTELCRRQPTVVQNHENVNVRNTDKGKAQHRKHERLKLGGGQAHDRSNI
jgi:hypothetical protein